MIEQDTIKLLRECDAGIKMGVASIDDVYKYVTSSKMKKCLDDCKDKHNKLDKDLQNRLEKFKDEGKDPNPIAKGMSHIKTNIKLGVDNSDKTIADLITDGCDMGIKSLSRYLNQYKAADEFSKNICKELIMLEEALRTDMQKFL